MSDNLSQVIEKIRYECLSIDGILVKIRIGIKVKGDEYNEIIELLQNYTDHTVGDDKIHRIVVNFIVAFDEVLNDAVVRATEEEKQHLVKVHSQVLNIMNKMFNDL